MGKFGHGIQILALLIFIVMALACASSESALINGGAAGVSGSDGGNPSSSKEGATNETPVDSIYHTYELALTCL